MTLGVDDLGGQPEQARDLVHDDVEHQVSKVVGVAAASLEGTAIHDDPGGPVAGGRFRPGECDPVPVGGRFVVRGHRLDRELHPVELCGPASVEVLDSIEDQLVEGVGLGPPKRQVRGRERSPSTPPTAVAAARERRGSGARNHAPDSSRVSSPGSRGPRSPGRDVSVTSATRRAVVAPVAARPSDCGYRPDL